MNDSHLKIFEYPFEASWPSLLPTAPLPLDNVAAPTIWDSSTVQTDPFSLPNGQLALPTTTDATDADQTAPTTEPNPFHSSPTSSFSTNDSNTDFAIRLLKPQPTQSGRIVLPRIETHVFLDIDLPSGSWNAIMLPLTKSVTSDDLSSIGGYIKPLLLVIIVRGATTRQECNGVCEQCEKRTGNKIGPPSLIDFHSSSNILTPRGGIIPRGGTIQVHFTFSCYSRHHLKQDKEYVLEVILKDASNPFEPIEVAREELPYSFDVRSSIPRTKGPASDHTQQATISSSSSIRRRAKHPGPAATTSPPSAQTAVGLHLGGIEGQLRQELMAGGVPNRELAGQRTSDCVSSIGGPMHQSPSDLQYLPSTVSASHPPATPKPLLVQPQYGLSGEEERGGTEYGQGSVITMRMESSSLYTNAPRTPSTSDPGPQHILSGSRGQSYDTSNTLGQQEPPIFAHTPNPSFESSHTPTNTEVQIRGKVADREVQINALENIVKHLRDTFEADGREKDAALRPLIEYLYSQVLSIQKEITDRLYAFSAERQKAGAAVGAEIANLEAQINTLKQENHHDASVLTAMVNTHPWMG